MDAMHGSTAGRIDPPAPPDPDARRKLYALMEMELPPAQALDRILEIGREYLSVAHGHVAQIDFETERYEIADSTDDADGRYPAGYSTDLGATYCRYTIRQETPLEITHAEQQGWADDAAYRVDQLETYLGMRISVAGETFGTLCFLDETPRPGPFSVEERIFVELAGVIAGQVLERSHHQNAVANRDRVINVLNRVLRHNLRNDLTVVRGYGQLIAEGTTDPEARRMATTITTHADELLSLSQKAKEFDRLTRMLPLPRPADVVPLAATALEEVDSTFPHAEYVFDAPPEATAIAAPRIELAIEELLRNAGRYAGPEPTVRLTVDRTPDAVAIRVADDGPGLPAGEARVLTEGDETPLEHGSGLGHFFVYWVVDNLGGEITVPEADGTTVELRLPRVTAAAADSGR